MKIRIDSIPDDGLHLEETRLPAWWTNFPELVKGSDIRFDGPVMLDIAIERTDSQVHVRGSIRAAIVTICSRCLKETTCRADAPVEVFFSPEQPGENDEQFEGYETYRGDEIDLGEYLRGQLALHFPSRFLCDSDCKGL